MECQGDDFQHYKPRFLTEWSVTIGGLPTLAIQNRPADVSPDMIVVFLHGYNSNTARTKKVAESVLNHCFLAPTSPFLQPQHAPQPTVLFLLPQAPHKLEGSNVFHWWPVPNIGFLFAFSLSGLRQLESYYPEQKLKELHALMRQYLACVDEQYRSCNAKKPQLVLGGFSQGSLLAADFMLRGSYTRKPDMLLLMSSTLIGRQVWRARIAECSRRGECVLDTYVLQTHGRRDIVLHYDEAKQFFTTLSANNSGDTELYSFDGGHDMTIDARHHVAIRLRELIDKFHPQQQVPPY